MRKFSLSLIGSFFVFLHSFAQYPTEENYVKPTLKLEETNLISDYYTHTGNHSAVTGGVGTQDLTDVANTIELKFVKPEQRHRKQTLDIDVGYDHHTAASAAYVTLSGKSPKGGSRINLGANVQSENTQTGVTTGIGAAISSEYTYHSFGLNALYSKHTPDDNRELTARGIVYLDGVKMIYPKELRSNTTVLSSASTGRKVSSSKIPSRLRSTFATSFSFSQVVNKNLQVALLGDFVMQAGYLGLPYHRVYHNDPFHTVGKEKLPSFRMKVPVGARFNYFLGDRFIFRTYYRYYIDTWGISAHTVSIEPVVKLTPFLSLSPFYRYYTQLAAKYFAPIYEHSLRAKFATSNYEYAAFHANYLGLNFRFVPLNGLFGIKNLSMIELRYGHYRQTTGLVANNISLNLRFK